MPKPKRERIRRESQVINKENKKMGCIDPLAPDDYKPFLLIHDFSSKGRSTRVRSGKRIHHLMSDLETMCLRELQWNQDVLEIYEQVLLDREETVKIAAEIGVQHPKLSDDAKPYPMTTDLVADIVGSDGKITRHAIAIKPASAVDYSGYDWNAETKSRRQRAIERTIEKLEIERRYWTKPGSTWSLVTDAVLTKVRATNIEIFLNTDEPGRRGQSDYWENVCKLVLHAIEQYPNRKIATVSRSIEQRFDIPAADLIFALRYLCKQRRVDFDLNVPFGPDCLGRNFKIVKKSPRRASPRRAA